MKSLRQQNPRLYQIWANMKYRCNTPTYKRYSRYGGRGIKVCDKWNNSFESFYDWSINNGYQDDLTLDRIDNDGNYEPNNCRWATYTQQNYNRSIAFNVTINGETKTTREWCKKYNLNYRTFIVRYSNYGWDIVDAITRPVERKIPSGYKSFEEEVAQRERNRLN